jgi:hypothetical protein
MGGIHFIPQIGETDSLLVTDTVAVTGKNFCAIYCVEDTVFNVLTGTVTVQGALADATFAAGTIIIGNFTGFDLTSGAVVAYYAKPPV